MTQFLFQMNYSINREDKCLVQLQSTVYRCFRKALWKHNDFIQSKKLLPFSSEWLTVELDDGDDEM